MNSTRTLVIGGSAVGTLATGWFLMSHFVMGTASVDAVNEAFGVALGLLVLLSVIGATLSRRGDQRNHR